MENLKEIRLNDNNLVLSGNIVPGGILPQKISELQRTVSIKSNSIVDGALYTSHLSIENGDVELRGAVYSQKEIYINSDAKGKVTFAKAVASSQAITSRANEVELSFCSDINAKEVTLCNAFVCGSIYADSIELTNCVVIGGVFASNSVFIKDSIVGTFNAQIVNIEGNVNLLLPSAFSLQSISSSNATLYNLSLADLGGLFKGEKQSEGSGKIEMNLNSDEMHTMLRDEETQVAINCYSVANKVIVADILDSDRFQNHFLLTASALGTQLLRSYKLDTKSQGEESNLSVNNLRHFFFDILSGKIVVQELSGEIQLNKLLK